MVQKKLKSIHGQPSWTFSTDTVSAAVTQTAGMLGPVTFSLKNGDVSPFSIAPWAENKEKIDKGLPPLLHALRGDFFCLPFGGNDNPYRGEQHPPHGDTANADWKFKKLKKKKGRRALHCRLKMKTRSGKVDKHIILRDGHTAVYQRHIVTGMSGAMTPGHHAMLKLPETPGCGRISTSAFVHGQVLPFPFENPEIGGYHALKPDSSFKNLSSVPMNDGTKTDLKTYPARKGFDDLVMVVSSARTKLAWTAVTFAKSRQVYFALKDPRVLRNTILWMSNGGRHYAPWNGRHTAVLGIEDVTAYYHIGLAESVKKNPLKDKGFPTSVTLNKNKPFVVNYIMGMSDIPAGFDEVKSIRQVSAEEIELVSVSGKRKTTKIDLDFLYGV